MILSALAILAEQMPKWDNETIDRFVDAEATLVTRQLFAPRGKGNVRTARRNMWRLMREKRAGELEQAGEREGRKNPVA